MINKKKRAKQSLLAAHYATAYLAIEGNLYDGLIFRGNTMTIETKKLDDGRFITRVEDAITGEIVLSAQYMQKRIGDYHYPDYRVRDVRMNIYQPGDWEKSIDSVREYALHVKRRSERRAYEDHYREYYDL